MSWSVDPARPEQVSLLRRQVQSSADRMRVEVEHLADALEGIWPVGFLGEEPLPHFVEEPSAAVVSGETVLFNTINSVLEDGDHELSLWCLLATPCKVLHRQDQVGFQHPLWRSNALAMERP